MRKIFCILLLPLALSACGRSNNGKVAVRKPSPTACAFSHVSRATLSAAIASVYAESKTQLWSTNDCNARIAAASMIFFRSLISSGLSVEGTINEKSAMPITNLFDYECNLVKPSNQLVDEFLKCQVNSELTGEGQ